MKEETGQATLELLLVLAVLVALLFGALDFARIYSASHALHNGAAVAARQIALAPDGWETALGGVQTAVEHSLFGGPGEPVACAVYDGGGHIVNPEFLPFGSRFSVSCTLAFQARIPFVPTDPGVLRAVHHEVMERYP